MPIVDARRGEVFTAVYRGGQPLSGPVVIPPSEAGDLIADVPETPLAAGSGAVRFRTELAPSGVDIPGDPDPVHRVSARQICELGTSADGVEGPARLEPNYLRPPDAERWRERNTSEGTNR